MAKQGSHGIAWCTETWNPIRGCSRVSEGCRNCYAERVAARFSDPGMPYEGLAIMKDGVGPRWTGVVRLVPKHLEDPLRWTKPRVIFVNSMSDFFHEALAEEDIVKMIDVMIRALRKQPHIFQVLTKRPERMREILRKIYPLHMTDGIWWGVSVEDQISADFRIPVLLDTPASIRWVSYEPAIGSVDFWEARYKHDGALVNAFNWGKGVNWIVVGGESGFNARPFDISWARKTVLSCKEVSVPVFVKQLGSNVEWDGISTPTTRWPTRNIGVNAKDTGKGTFKVLLKDKKGGDMDEWPLDLRIRQFPKLEDVNV